MGKYFEHNILGSNRFIGMSYHTLNLSQTKSSSTKPFNVHGMKRPGTVFVTCMEKCLYEPDKLAAISVLARKLTPQDKRP